jgi:hypothetical protein
MFNKFVFEREFMINEKILVIFQLFQLFQLF